MCYDDTRCDGVNHMRHLHVPVFNGFDARPDKTSVLFDLHLRTKKMCTRYAGTCIKSSVLFALKIVFDLRRSHARLLIEEKTNERLRKRKPRFVRGQL